MNKMRRQFQRECMKLEMNDKKMQKDLKKMMNNNTPQVNLQKCRSLNVLSVKIFLKIRDLQSNIKIQMHSYKIQCLSTSFVKQITVHADNGPNVKCNEWNG